MLVVTPVVIPITIPKALRTITVQMTRDGQQTPSQKVVLLMDLVFNIQAVFVGAYTDYNVFLSSAIDGTWLMVGFDFESPARSTSRIITVTEDLSVALDLNDGSGSGGSGGADALVSARVAIAGLPAARNIVVVEQLVDATWRVVGNGMTGAGGEADIALKVASSSLVYAVAIDDWGRVYQNNLVVEVGTVIRPPLFSGWLYRITEAGTLPAVEPQWWDDSLTGPQQLGTARAEVVRYYRPLAHGPIPVELT